MVYKDLGKEARDGRQLSARAMVLPPGLVLISFCWVQARRTVSN